MIRTKPKKEKEVSKKGKRDLYDQGPLDPDTERPSLLNQKPPGPQDPKIEREGQGF